MSRLSLAHYRKRLEETETSQAKGKVIQVVGLLIEGSGEGDFPRKLDPCHIHASRGPGGYVHVGPGPGWVGKPSRRCRPN